MVTGVVFIVLDRFLSKWSTENRWLRVVLSTCGLLLSTFGLLSAAGFADRVGVSPMFGVAALTSGAVLVFRSGSARVTRQMPRPEQVRIVAPLTVAIVVLAAFWEATLYAQNLGKETARTVDASPRALLPSVTVFSKEFLDLPGSEVNVSEVNPQRRDSHYRYTGLSLLTYSNNRWFLITGKYSDSYRSSVATLQDSGDIHVEVARPESNVEYNGP